MVRRSGGGWLEFTCNYPTPNQKYDRIKVNGVRGTFRRLNTWENINNFLLYHDTKKKSVTLGIKQRLQLPRSEYEIKFGKEKRPTKTKKKDDDDDDDDEDYDKRKIKVSVGKRLAFSSVLVYPF